MPYGLPNTSVFPLTNHSFIAPRPRPTSPSLDIATPPQHPSTIRLTIRLTSATAATRTT